MDILKFEYVCDRCGHVEILEHGINTVYRNKPCPKCDNGFLAREYLQQENKSASIVHKYDEKAADVIRSRQEKTNEMLAKIKHKNALMDKYKKGY